MSEITCTRLAMLIIDARAHVKQNAAEKLALILRDRDMRWFRVNISAISPISPGGFWLLKPKWYLSWQTQGSQRLLRDWNFRRPR